MTLKSIDRCELSRLFLQDTGGSNISVADAFANVCADPSDAAIRQYAISRQAEAFTKKACPASGPVPRDLENEAFAKFLQIESENRLVNDKIVRWVRSEEIPDYLIRARDLVHRVLVPFEWVEEDVWSQCRFGPGASFGAGGPEGRHLISKIAGKQTVTMTAFPLICDVASRFFPHWEATLRSCPTSLVAGNRLAYVHKDVSKCRPIAVEPSLNMFLQLGVGNWMVNRLAKFGVTLRDQDRNKALAKQASIDECHATIDLSDASMRICRELVRFLVPSDWYALFDAIRSLSWTYKNKTGHYEMYSSQGNAFTFPLESLIFWAICKSITGDVTVYGDDIIVPTSAAHRVIEVLSDVGFVVNRDKSFVAGPFRESCGGDYIRGVDVRPHYYKHECVRYSDVAKLHNSLLQKWGWLPKTLEYLRSRVPSDRILFGPRYVVTDESHPGVNSCKFMLEQWFHVDLWELPDTIDYLRAWETTPRDGKWCRLYDEQANYLAFLYSGGNDYVKSTLERRYIKRYSVSRDMLRDESF